VTGGDTVLKNNETVKLIVQFNVSIMVRLCCH